MFCLLKRIFKRNRKDNTNLQTLEIIDAIIETLTPEQIKNLNLERNGKQVNFRDRLIAHYGNFFPVFSSSLSREISKKIIQFNGPFIEGEANMRFLNSFSGILFQSKKGFLSNKQKELLKSEFLNN